MENNMLKVHLDLAKGTCTVSRNDGKEIIVREIKDGTTSHYAKNVMDERLKEIEKIEGKNGWIASDLLKGIDPVLYDTLEAFDAKYGTEYRHIYANAASMSITYTEVGVPNMSMKNRRIYAKKASEIRTEKLQKAGISIEYDVNPLKAAKEIGVMERIRAMRTANLQKAVGAKVGKNQGPSIIERITSLRETVSQKISDARAQRIQKKLEASQKRLEASIPRDENGLIDDVPELSEEELEAMRLAQTGVTIDISNPVMQNQGIADSVTPEQQPEQIPTAPVTTQRMEQKAKKDVRRSKSIQASKNAARQAGKMKNSYQERIKAKADAKKAAEEGRKKAEAVNAEKAKKAEEAAKLQAERQAIEKAIKIQQRKNEAKAKRQAEEAARALNEKKLSTKLSRKLKSMQDSIRNKVHISDINEYKRKIAGAVTIAAEKAKEMKKEAVVRFTRKLRDAQDSIRNKAHMPKLTGPQKKIAGVAAAFALVGAIGLGVAATQANADATARIPVTPTVPIAEAMESTRPELGDIDHFVNIDKLGHKNNLSTNGVQETEQKAPEVEQEKSEEEQKREYLSSIRVGSNMKIESGKYFASPDGTGNYGHFENYTDGVKQITIIDVITRDGVIVVKDSDVSLYDLKQQYPDAKFSYHLVCVRSDGSKTTLGWLTENSMEQNLEIETPQQVDEGR